MTHGMRLLSQIELCLLCSVAHLGITLRRTPAIHPTPKWPNNLWTYFHWWELSGLRCVAAHERVRQPIVDATLIHQLSSCCRSWSEVRDTFVLPLVPKLWWNSDLCGPTARLPLGSISCIKPCCGTANGGAYGTVRKIVKYCTNHSISSGALWIMVTSVVWCGLAWYSAELQGMPRYGMEVTIYCDMEYGMEV